MAHRSWPLDRSPSVKLLHDVGPCCALRSTQSLVIRAVLESRLILPATLTGWSLLGIRLLTTDHASVSVYLAASPSADRLSVELPREPLEEEIEQLNAQLERAKALKAATAAPQQLAAPSRRFVEPPTSYGSHYDKYAVPISSSVSPYDPGVPLVASSNRYTYANTRPLERSYSFCNARTFERPRVSRPLVVAPSAVPPSASTFDTVAASLPALAASFATSQTSHAALKVAASGYSAPISQAPLPAIQQTPSSHSSEVFAENCPSSSSGLTGSKTGPALPPGGLTTTLMKIRIKRNVIKTSITSVNANF